MTELEQYYNKFNEEKRLNSRHGQVEYRTSMHYIHEIIEKMAPPEQVKIIDIGAGTGRYAVPLADEGYDVTAVELVKHNLGRLKAKGSRVDARWGNALNLSKFAEETFDVALLFGPLYHLFGFEQKLRALLEAKRVLKTEGVLLAAYCMNEYAVLTYAFKEKNIGNCLKENRLTADFHCRGEERDLYDYVRVEDIDSLAKAAGFVRKKLISADGAANYMRPTLKEMDAETFEQFMAYHLATCERPELVGAGAHTVDILYKTEMREGELDTVRA